MWTIIQPFLPMLSPIVLAGLKEVAPELLRRTPNKYKVLLSALIGLAINLMSNMAIPAQETVPAVVSGLAFGLAGSKFRDLVVGKPGACGD